MAKTQKMPEPVSWNEIRLLDQNSRGFKAYYQEQMRFNGALGASLKRYDMGRVRLVRIQRIHTIHPTFYTQTIETVMKGLTKKKIFRPVIITPTGSLRDGHHRLAACRKLKLTHVPAFVMVKKGSKRALEI